VRVSEGNPGGRRDPVAGVERRRGATIVRLAGELDLYNVHEVREALLACVGEQPDRVVVDLGEVEFLDSTALGTLVEARSRMADKNAFVLAAPGTQPRRALEVSGLDRHFTVHATVDDALAGA
jgi:anti-sigma B factor antagonist